MSRVVRRKKNMQKNRFKTVLIVLAIAVCLFVIYKFNFTTRSEVEVTTPVKFKEFEGKNELQANIPVLEDDKGKYIILPEKVNGIFTSAYYLSDKKDIEEKDNTDIENTTVENTISNTAVENNISNEILENTVSNNNTISNTTSNNTVKNEVTNQITENTNTVTNTTNETTNSTENTNTINNTVTNENTVNKVENEIVEDKTQNEEINKEKNIEEQIEALNESESLFDKVTKDSEEYADKLEEIAESNTKEDELPAENNETEEKTEQLPTNEEKVEQLPADEEQANSEEPVKEVPETGNEIITQKLETMPGEKYYLSKEELENEDLELTVKFQMVEINGVQLYNQELTADMINAVIKLTCYTPLGYYLDVKDEDVNNIQELKSDVEKLAESETILAYDIKITNGEKEYQPEDYYQVATVSITKPEALDFKSNSHSLQLLHIKEDEEEIAFERMQMTKIENDGFEFLTNEFSIYAVILFNAITDEQVTIDDYMSDYNYLMGKNYTDNAGKYKADYTDDNLAKVIVNYHGNVTEGKLYEQGQKEIVVDRIIDTSTTENFSTQNLTLEDYNVMNNNGGTRNVSLTFALEDITPDMIPPNSTFTLTNLNLRLANNYNIADSNNTSNTYTYNRNIITSLTVEANDYNRNNNTITIIIRIRKGNGGGNFNPNLQVTQVTLNGRRYRVTEITEKYNYKTELTTNDSGYISATERQNIVSYVKCMPVVNGNVSFELIDNPFMDRVTAKTEYYDIEDTEFNNPLDDLDFEKDELLHGFNGWKNANGQNYTISFDNRNKVQTLTAPCSPGGTITIDLYANWEKANTVYVSANGEGNGDAINDLLGCGDLGDAVSKLVRNGIATASNASNRELNIIVVVSGTIGANQFRTQNNCAYTVTSLYAGHDYRQDGASVRSDGDVSLSTDLQLDFLNITNGGNYETTGNGNDYINANGYNLRIGRGMKPLNDAATFGLAEGGWRNTKSRFVVESGNYAQIYTVNGNMSITGSGYVEVIIGTDYDRIKGDNTTLNVYDRFSGRSQSGVANLYENNTDVYKSYVKSGTIGVGCFENEGDSDANYAGIYVGGHSSSTSTGTHDKGNRTLIVEGGNIANIIGGLYIYQNELHETYIYVKGGNVINIVGGAGYTHTYGNRIIQVTDGFIKYSISGGSNGVGASSTDNNGQLSGKSLIYVGGAARVGASAKQNPDGTQSIVETIANSENDYLYGVLPGSVCGGANGNTRYAGQTDGSHIIIDKEAIVYGNVFGGGNFGFIENSSNDVIELVSGEAYNIFNGDNCLHRINDNEIRLDPLVDDEDESFQWKVELAGASFYLINGGEYLVAPDVNNSNAFSYTTNKANATLFTYNSAKKITYKGARNTYYLALRNNVISASTANLSGLTFNFNTIPNNIVKIDVLGGRILNKVFGGANKNKIVGNVGINVSGGIIEQTVYGGSNETGNIEGNVSITITGGTIGKTLSQDSVFGGGFGSRTTINKNVKLIIKDTSNNINILGNVYGGGAEGNITGTTKVKIEDHFSDNYTISMSGNVFGGGKGVKNGTSPTSGDNVTVTVDGGTYENLSVYGGYNANGTIPNKAVAVNIGENYITTVNEVYGGGNEAVIANTTTSVIVKLFKNAYVNSAYNGGNNAGINGNNTREIHSIGAHVKTLFGGSNNSGALNFTNVYVIANSEIENVFGGGNEAEITGNTNVDILDSTITESAYGGGNNAPVGTYTEIEIQNSKINNIYGGGNAGSVNGMTPPNGNSTNVNISKESQIETVYGGGCAASIRVNSNVYIENSTINNVYGGGEGLNAIVEGDTSVNLQGVQIDGVDNNVAVKENVYGGGDQGKVNGNAVIVMNKANVEGSVFGGGNKADIQNNASVISEKSIANNIYGGGMNGAIGGSTAVTIIEESTINNNVYGGGSKGKVSRNTVVVLDNSKVLNDLFGGGEAAEVNGTTVSLTNGSIAENVYGGGDNGITITNTNVALRNVKINQSAFGGGNGAPAIVKGKSYIYADGTTTIGKSLFAGGNNSATGTTDTNPNADLENKPLAKASAVVDIAGATIGENVYGGANTSVIYGDVAVNIGTEAIKNYYTSINEGIPTYTSGKINIGGTIYGGGEQMDPNKEYNYDTVSVEGYIKINIDGTGYTSGDNTLNIMGSIFGSGHASRAGLPTSYIGDITDGDQTAGYVTINGDVNIKNYGSVKAPKSMVSIQRCKNVVLDKSALWISGATDSTNTHSATYFSFNHIDALKLKNDSTLYLRATSNLLKSFYSVVDVDGKEEKATVKIINEITGEDGKTYDAVGNYIYDLFGNIEYVLKSGQIFTADKDGNALELVTDVKNSKTKSVEKNVDNRVYMYSGLNLNISSDENLGDDTWGPVEGMTFFGIFNTSNTDIDKDEDVDISQTTDTNNDFSTIHTGIYDVDYSVSDTTPVKWNDRNYNRCYVEGKHVKSPQEQDIQKDGFYTNYEKFGIPYGDDEEIEEGNYDAHNPTSYTDYIVPTPDETNYYIWYAGPDQDFYYYDLALIASKLSTYGTIEKTLQGISVANATFKITGVDSSLINGAVLYEKSKISNINTTGNPNREFALAMKTGGSGWSMNGETDFVTSPNVNYSGTQVYKTENSNTTPTLGFYLYHSNNISEEQELGFFTINMILYYWKTPTQQAKARVTIDVAIATKVYEDLGYDASITPGRQYELFPRTNTNITTKSSFSAYFQLHEKDFANNKDLKKFFSHKEYADDNDIVGVDVVDTELIEEFIKTNYRLIKTDYVFPEDTTITMIDKSTDNPTYYYYTVTEQDNTNKKKAYRLSEFKKMGSTSEIPPPDTAEYYSDDRRSEYVTTVNENGTDVTYQSENFIFIVDFESAKFKNIDTIYEVVKNQAFHLVLTSDVKNKEGEALEISVLEEYKERNSISFGIYNTESTIKIAATLSPNKIYVGDSTEISIETNYITENKDPSNVTIVYDTRYFASKLGVKITIFDEAGDVVHGANLLGAYFKITEADGTTTSYYPRTDGTTRMKIADKVSNSKATISFETEKSALPTGTYKFLIESFGSADGVYFGVESSDSTELTLSIINDEFGLDSEIPSNYVIVDKETGYTIEDTTGFNVEKEYEILDENGDVIGDTTEELNEGKNDFEYSVKYSSGYENPYIAVSMYRRNYDSVYDRTYSLVDLADYLDIQLSPVPDNIKEQFVITDYDDSGNETKKYVGYEAYGIDFINKAVEDAIAASPDPSIRPIIKLTTKCSLREKLVSGTYKLVFTLYDKSEVEKIVEIVNEDGTITAELQKVIEYQRIGDTYSYVIIK